MKKKGFTLVELLAVIVILAIIALIATPMILNVIENAKKGAKESSALGYIDALEKGILEQELKGNDIEKTGVYKVSSLTFVNVKGDKPSDGWVSLNKGVVTDYSLKIGEYVINYDEITKKIITTKNGTLDTTPSDPSTISICTYVEGGSAKGTVGAKYTCEVASGITKTFYLLSTNDSEETARLIMNRNYTDASVPKTMSWCDQSGSNPSVNTCNHDGLDPYIDYLDNLWTEVSVDLPSYDDIHNLNNSDTLTDTPWIYENLSTGEEADAYWTSSAIPSPSIDAFNVRVGLMGGFVTVDISYWSGIRPVIIVDKSFVL